MKKYALVNGQRLWLAVALALTLTPLPGLVALAQSDSESPLVTPINPRVVTLVGTVVAFGEDDENEWIISTDQGKVLVEAGPRWHHTIDLAMDEQVTVTGEFDGGEFDAFRIVRADGTRVEVRPYFGPPPWAEQEDR